MTRKPAISKIALALFVILGAAQSYAQVYTDLYNFDGSLGSSPTTPQPMAQGQDGNLYGSTPYGGTAGSGAVFVVNSIGVLSDIYSFLGPDGSYPNGDVTLGTDGSFYGTTTLGGTYCTATFTVM